MRLRVRRLQFICWCNERKKQKKKKTSLHNSKHYHKTKCLAAALQHMPLIVSMVSFHTFSSLVVLFFSAKIKKKKKRNKLIYAINNDSRLRHLPFIVVGVCTKSKINAFYDIKTWMLGSPANAQIQPKAFASPNGDHFNRINSRTPLL